MRDCDFVTGVKNHEDNDVNLCKKSIVKKILKTCYAISTKVQVIMTQQFCNNEDILRLYIQLSTLGRSAGK